MNVDWSKTNQGRKYYNRQSAVDFAAAGISHVRIRIADKVDQELLEGLDRQIRDCLDNGIIPIIAYQADAFKNDPSDKNIEKALEKVVLYGFDVENFLNSIDVIKEVINQNT